MAKRLLAALLALAAAASLSACGLFGRAKPSDTGSRAPEESAAAPSSAQEERAPETAEEPDPSTPEGAVLAAFAAVKALDLDKIEQYLESDAEDGGFHLFGRGMNEQESRLAAALVAQLACEPGEAAVDGDNATLEARVTNKDLTGVVGKFAAYAVTESLKEAVTGPDARAEERYIAKLAELVEEADGTHAADITLRLRRSGDSWKIQTDLELLDALSGGMMGQLAQFTDQLSGLAEKYGQ